MSEATATYSFGQERIHSPGGQRPLSGAWLSCPASNTGRPIRLQRLLRISEGKIRKSKGSLPESVLHSAWRNLSADSQVKARDGHSYRVIYSGRPADGAGPDFRDAILLRDDGKQLHGHVEIHIRLDDWHRHGHTSDPAYNGVVFQVVLEDRGTSVRTPSGLRIPLLVLGRKTAGSHNGVTAQHSSSIAHLRTPAVSSLPLPTLDAAEAGDEWFKNRVHGYRLQVEANGVEQTLWEGALECLGYPYNKRGFRQLASRLNWDSVAGLLRNISAPDISETFQRAAGFSDTSVNQSGQQRRIFIPIKPPEWNSRFGRPANSPRTRVKAAAAWAERWSEVGGPLKAFVNCVRKAGRAGELSDLFTVSAKSGGIAPLGRARAGEIVINHLIPSVKAVALMLGDRQLAERCDNLFEQHPKLSSNGITREAGKLLAARGKNGNPSSAREQQGLIQIYHIATATQRPDQQLPLL